MLTSLFTEKLSLLFIRMEYTVEVGANKNYMLRYDVHYNVA